MLIKSYQLVISLIACLIAIVVGALIYVNLISTF